MRVKPPEMARLLARPDPAIRLYLLFGPDESGVRALADGFAAAQPADSERIELTAAQLKADPARLADEAAALSLFGGSRFVWVTLGDGGDEALAAVDALLAAPTAGNPVLILGGNISATSKFVKRIEGDGRTSSCICYEPNPAEMHEIIRGLARERGLTVDGESVRMLAGLTANDRALAARELDKLALYLDASPQTPRQLTPDAVAALGADTQEEDIGGLVNAMLGGDADRLMRMLAEAEMAGLSPIRLFRTLAARVDVLARLRPEVDRGTAASRAVDSAGRAVFFKEKAAVADQLARWRSPHLARLIHRILATEAALKQEKTAGFVLFRQLAADMCRQAAATRARSTRGL